MIKCRTIGAYQVEVNNPVIVLENDIANYSFVTVDDSTYLVSQEFNGDLSNREGIVIPAGMPVRGYDLHAWIGLELVIDMKHIPDGDYDSIEEGNALTINEDGTLAVAESASDGYYLTVTGKTTLTENAVIAKVCKA